MTKKEFQDHYGFDCQQIEKIDKFRAIFGCKTPCVVTDQKDGKWVFEVIEKRKINARS